MSEDNQDKPRRGSDWQQDSQEIIIDRSVSSPTQNSQTGTAEWVENEDVSDAELSQARAELEGAEYSAADSMEANINNNFNSDTNNGNPENNNTVNNSGGDWQQDVIDRLAFSSLNEQRRTRRWGIFFKSLAFVYVGVFLFYLPSDWSDSAIGTSGKHTALVDVSGVIAANSEASADRIVSGLRAAFKNQNTKAVIVRINSPGGSPVQAGYVYDEIRRLRKQYTDIKLYAVITDVCASGGYYIAAAADEIYADKASLVGSIGVLMNGFGFVEVIKKLGVERRLLTAGEHKGILDPFSEVKKSEKIHVQAMLDGVHKQFIDVVKEGRGDRLKKSSKLFSGLFWNGEDGVELGLVDGLGSAGFVARDIIGAEKIVDFTPRINYFDKFADRIGTSIASYLSMQLGLQGPQLQ